MKRKNLIARKKVKKELIFKDPKILNYYTKFKSIIFKNIKNKSFALAVSGGPDSLCLAYFAKVYSSEFGNKISAYTNILNFVVLIPDVIGSIGIFAFL